MNNQITDVVSKLLSDSDSANLLGNLINSLNIKTDAKNENIENSELKNENPKSSEIQKKIDILTALLPMFGNEHKVKIEKIIKALQIIKMFLIIL